MTPDARKALLEEEVIILRNSGEIPEIALHSSLYYLEEDEEGPRISLRDEELELLYDAALVRAREIVLRDLDPANRDLRIYRGPARSIVNWHRLQNFCGRIERECLEFSDSVAAALIFFLEQEIEDCEASLRTSCINCTSEDIHAFCNELSLDPELLPAGWQSLCCD